MTAALATALKSVDWDKNVATFLSESGHLLEIDESCKRIAVWSKQFENLDSDNPAITFVRAFQSSAHHSVCCFALGLYKASAASIREIFENALYYTYFRSHPLELASLVRDSRYFASKADILDFHLSHTPRYKELQSSFGLGGRIDEWYSHVSAVVHGQLPGTWLIGKGIADTAFHKTTLESAVTCFCTAELLAHDLFLCTMDLGRWDEFSHTSKKYLLKGVSGAKKTALQFDGH